MSLMKLSVSFYYSPAERNVYENSPTLSKEKLADAALDDNMSPNPIYNLPTPTSLDARFDPYTSAGSTSPVVHVVQNSLYTSTTNTDAVIYEQIGSSEALIQSGDDTMSSSVTTNVAYATGRSKKQECIDNPMYGVTVNKSSEEPPIYNVPRPAELPRNEGRNAYAPLSNGSTPSHTPNPTSPNNNVPAPKSSEAYYDNVEHGEKEAGPSTEKTVGGSEGLYDMPTAATGGGQDKKSSMGYSKLQHKDVAVPPPATDSEGYRSLGTN